MANTIRQIIEFGTEGSTWESWNGSLVHYFGEEPIPYMAEEDNWRDVASTVVSLPTFVSYAPPDPADYITWQSWANDFIVAVNGPTY